MNCIPNRTRNWLLSRKIVQLAKWPDLWKIDVVLIDSSYGVGRVEVQRIGTIDCYNEGDSSLAEAIGSSRLLLLLSAHAGT